VDTVIAENRVEIDGNGNQRHEGNASS
jgi:hypothetical protein